MSDLDETDLSDRLRALEERVYPDGMNTPETVSFDADIDESTISHDEIDQSTVDPDDHHARDHATRHGAGSSTDELATALRYAPEDEPATPDAGVVRWYDSTEDAFKAKFDDGTSVTLAQE